jgi:FlaG/FlaF family flagellin (archaellin)
VTRAVSAVVGVPLLVGVTVVLAAVIGVVALGFAPPPASEPVALSADATTDGRIEVTHRSGEPINVTEVSMLIEVDGESLDEQPPVPFFSASGFAPGPTGAFNDAGDTVLAPGERASLEVAGTNDPPLVEGATIRIRFVREETQIAVVETTVTAA